MIKALLAKIRRLEREVQALRPQQAPGMFTNRFTRGTTRRPAAKTGAGNGSGGARWA